MDVHIKAVYLIQRKEENFFRRNVMELKKRKLIRIFIPRFPNFNIYTLTARTTTSVGPLFVATSAAKLDCWDAEVIDENNLHGKFYPNLVKI